jgi:hypothetical protein
MRLVASCFESIPMRLVASCFESIPMRLVASCSIIPMRLVASCFESIPMRIVASCFESMCMQHKCFSVTNARDMYSSHILSPLSYTPSGSSGQKAVNVPVFRLLRSLLGTFSNWHITCGKYVSVTIICHGRRSFKYMC